LRISGRERHGQVLRRTSACSGSATYAIAEPSRVSTILAHGTGDPGEDGPMEAGGDTPHNDASRVFEKLGRAAALAQVVIASIA
jgi:hypothetical protein